MTHFWVPWTGETIQCYKNKQKQYARRHFGRLLVISNEFNYILWAFEHFFFNWPFLHHLFIGKKIHILLQLLKFYQFWVNLHIFAHHCSLMFTKEYNFVGFSFFFFLSSYFSLNGDGMFSLTLTLMATENNSLKIRLSIKCPSMWTDA